MEINRDLLISIYRVGILTKYKDDFIELIPIILKDVLENKYVGTKITKSNKKIIEFFKDTYVKIDYSYCLVADVYFKRKKIYLRIYNVINEKECVFEIGITPYKKDEILYVYTI